MGTVVATEIFQRKLDERSATKLYHRDTQKSLLHDLIQKDAHYKITDIHKQAFACIKSEFSEKISLPYFRLTKSL